MTDAPNDMPTTIDDGYRIVGQSVDGLPKPTFDFVGYDASLVLVCPGDAHRGLGGAVGAALERAPLRRCRLQMMQTGPAPESLATSVADGDSMRYYPAFDLPGRSRLAPPAQETEAFGMQLIAVTEHPSIRRTAEAGCSWCGGVDELDELLRRADFVFLCLPLTDSIPMPTGKARFDAHKAQYDALNKIYGTYFTQGKTPSRACMALEWIPGDSLIEIVGSAQVLDAFTPAAEK